MRKIAHLFLCFLLISCHKITKDIITSTLIEKPEISISQRIVSCKVQNNTNYPIETDTAVMDSVFVMYRISNTSQYDPITLVFDSRIKEGQLQSIQWKIGADTTIRTASGFGLTFNQPTGGIKISVMVTWVPYKTARAQTDTIEKEITISAMSSLLGYFKGSNIDAPNDTFTVFIGELIQNVVPSTDRCWGIQNIFKGFPYNIPVNLFSKGFGVCAAPFPYQDRYNIGGKYYSQVYARGFLSQNRDSISIDYAYVQYKDLNSFDSIKTINKTFIGKKL